MVSIFNPRYLDFARHHGFTIAPCNVGRGNEKGRVESGVGYVKKNFLLNARHHVRKILALAEIYPVDAVARAISDGLAFQAFSAEYITNILEARARALPEPAPLQLTRRHDLLDIDIAPPDLNAYEVNDHDSE